MADFIFASMKDQLRRIGRLGEPDVRAIAYVARIMELSWWGRFRKRPRWAVDRYPAVLEIDGNRVTMTLHVERPGTLKRIAIFASDGEMLVEWTPRVAVDSGRVVVDGTLLGY